jgi:hypothetical protein
MKIYVSKSGQRYGPYSVEELRAEVLKGAFQPENFASSNNGESWVAISALPGIGPLTYSVCAQPEQNLLRLSYRGTVTAAEAAECARAIEASLTTLRPKFRLFSDFSQLESMERGCASHIKRIMDLCNQQEIESVVRVIARPEQDIGLAIMSLFHYRPEVRIITCETVAEAEEILRESKNTTEVPRSE